MHTVSEVENDLQPAQEVRAVCMFEMKNTQDECFIYAFLD